MWKRKVSQNSKDLWDFTGVKEATIHSIDLETGESTKVNVIFDWENNEFIVECKRCGRNGTYKLSLITDNQHASGLCPDCFEKENPSYFICLDENNKLIKMDPKTKKVSSLLMSETEFDNLKKMSHPNIQYKLKKCSPTLFKKSNNLSFVGKESDYSKSIENFNLIKKIDNLRLIENWKQQNPEAFLDLISWDDDGNLTKKFIHKYPNIRSHKNSSITTHFINIVRENSNLNPIKVISNWRYFEENVRSMINSWGELDARRYLIHKIDEINFCYREIDALAISSKYKVVIDAKWAGGIINPSKMKLYIESLKKIGIPISLGIYVTSDDRVEKISSTIFRIPHLLFKSADSIDLIVDFIKKYSNKFPFEL